MPDPKLTALRDLFSDYRAEWPAGLFGDLFIAPPYFEKLETARPCLLIGGRGTGKTTALRSLRFDATAERLASDRLSTDSLPYFGLYIRINKNRVRAFKGPQLEQADWDAAFAHYFNILVARELSHLVRWLDDAQIATSLDLREVADSFGCRNGDTVGALAAELENLLIQLELYVNNPTQAPRPLISMAEAPIRRFVDLIDRALGNRRPIFCCIDEYENLLDSQQGILNTYIKHSEPPLSYKIGVRRGGLRNRATTDAQDVLATPEDYLEIEIGREEGFDDFARQVIEHRLERARERGLDVVETVDEFLPDLPMGIEAELLGCQRIADEVLEEIVASGDNALTRWARDVPKNQLYFLRYWADGAKDEKIVDLARSWMTEPSRWSTRLGNHGYASLFWLSKGRKGARIRKYYAGARTLLGLASGNIRYFVELIDESLGATLTDSAEWTGQILPRHQTLAARAVGKRRLDQVEWLSEHGSEVKRLVLALGKVFFEFARDPVGRSPERNSFVITGSPEAQKRVLRLLQEGVSTLAFEVTPRTKATTQREMRDDEFRLHPIFAPFFEFSHRKKRRCVFSADTLLEVFMNPAKALATLIQRTPTRSEDLPQQLALFSSFYEAKAETPE